MAGSAKEFIMIGQLAKLAALGAGGAGLMAGPVKLASMTGQKKLDAKKREADAEMKRESRGVEKPANFDAIEEAKQEAKDRAAAKMQEKAYNESLTTEGKAKGGKIKKMASGGVTRADGIAKRGKTRGKMV
jgi:hypothetical protein